MKKTTLFITLSLLLLVGGVNVFSQTNGAPIVWTGNATVSGNNYTTLNGQVNPNGYQTTYYFEYGQTTSLGQITPTQIIGSNFSNNNVSYVVSGLYSNTTYFYRLTAVNSYGTSQGSIVSFTSSGNNNPIDSGSVVTTNPATDISNTSATLNAYINNSYYQSSGWFEFGTDPSSLTTRSIPVSIYAQNNYNYFNASQGQSFSFKLTGLSLNASYYFRAATIDNNGYKSYGQTLNFVTGTNYATNYIYPNLVTNQNYQSNYVAPQPQVQYVAPQPQIQYIYQQPKIVYLNEDGSLYTGQQTQNLGNGSTYQQGNQFYAPYYGLPTNIPPSQNNRLTASVLGSAGNVAGSAIFGGLLLLLLIVLIIVGFAKRVF
jgi:hypothetical protein